jgi:hypothetical protein
MSDPQPIDIYAPNQQLVRGDASGPAEEGDGGSPPNETGVGGPTDEPTPKAGDGYDPGEHTVAQISEWAAAATDAERQAALKLEQNGKNRAGAITALEATYE